MSIASSLPTFLLGNPVDEFRMSPTLFEDLFRCETTFRYIYILHGTEKVAHPLSDNEVKLFLSRRLLSTVSPTFCELSNLGSTLQA